MDGIQRRSEIWRAVLTAMVLLVCLPSSAASYVCVANPTELQAQLDIAAANSADDEIRLVQGTYAGHFTYVATGNFALVVRGGYTGDCSTTPSSDPSLTIIDAGGTGRAFLATSSAQFSLTLENLTFQNGGFLTNAPETYQRNGAGLYANNTILSVDRCSFLNNRADYNYKGGGLFVKGPNTTTQVVRNSRFENNSSRQGGGAYFETVNMAQVENCVLRNNDAVDWGGGICLVMGVVNGRFVSNEFAGNFADVGGGLASFTSASVVLAGNVLSGNGAYSTGGGAYLVASVIVTNNTFSGNGSAQGGGLYLSSSSSSDTVKLRNNIIQGNYAAPPPPDPVVGGDIYINQTSLGGYGAVEILDNDFKQSSPDGFYNSKAGFVIDPSNLNDQNPLFVAPSLLPAPTSDGDYRIGGGSPCIDQGDNAAPELPAADKAGNPRIVNSVVDMGAWEFPLPPEAPTGLAASDGTFTTKVVLTWNDVAGEDGYHIYRADAEMGEYLKIGDAPANATSYDDPIACETGYWYKVSAFNLAGESGLAGPDQGSAGICPPPAPAFVTASHGAYLDRVSLSWENVAGEVGYYIYRAVTFDGIYEKIGDAAADVTSYDHLLGCEQLFWYKVSAYNSGGESPQAGPDDGYTMTCPPPPPTPALVSASHGTFADRVRVSWEDVAGESGYRIYRADTEAGNPVHLGDAAADAVTYDDLSVTCGQAFWYRVSAFNAYGESALSAPAAGSTEACPLFTETFLDRRILDHWRVWSGSWRVTALAPQSLYSSPSYDNIITARFGSLRTGRVVADLRRTLLYTQYPNAAIVFAFRDAANYRYVQLKGNRIIISQKGRVGLAPPGSVFVSRSFPFPITGLQRLQVDIKPGGWVEVYRNSESIPRARAKFPDAPLGKVGFWAFQAKSLFDNFAAWNASVLIP